MFYFEFDMLKWLYQFGAYCFLNHVTSVSGGYLYSKTPGSAIFGSWKNQCSSKISVHLYPVTSQTTNPTNNIDSFGM